MEYIKVAWIHDFDDEPILLYSELDDGRNEIRKIEVYRDDSFGIASKDFEFGGTLLGLEPVPSIDEIKDDAQFVPYLIDGDEFEDIWLKYVNFLIDKSKE